jgi:hypothetical protein
MISCQGATAHSGFIDRDAPEALLFANAFAYSNTK